MIGGGLGNIGLGNLGIMGQQPWQKKARTEKFEELYNKYFRMSLGAADINNPTEKQKINALSYATSYFPQGTILEGGQTTGSGRLLGRVGPLPKMGAGAGVVYPTGSWWSQDKKYKFPFQ
jgi:hypothetical protein